MERTLKVYYAVSGNPEYPMIRLSGRWVRDAGFQPGDYIKLRVTDNEILIRNMDIQETTPDDGI